MPTKSFPYRFDNRFAGIWWPLGARKDRDGVTVTDGRLVATYGRFRVDTPLSNVADTSITGSYRWYKAVGVRLAVSDSGLTFGTNADLGVCLQFHEPVPKVLGYRPHDALTVTVADCEGLVSAIAAADSESG